MDESFDPKELNATEELPLFEVPDDVEVSALEKVLESEYQSSLNRCIYCRIILDPSDNDTYSEVLTWLRGKNKDSSTLRTYTGRLMCGACVNLVRSGISPTQRDIMELIDSEPEKSPVIKEAFTDQSEGYKFGWTHGYTGTPVPDNVLVEASHEALMSIEAGYRDGCDKREEDRWK